MIEKRRVKFFQITASDGCLFGVDGQGQVWMYHHKGNPIAKQWTKLEGPEEEVKINYRPCTSKEELTDIDMKESTFHDSIKAI